MLERLKIRLLLSYLGSFAIILAALALGKGISALLPFAFPGSILGMLLLFLLLNFQLIKLHWVLPAGGLLLRHMALLFVPVAVGLLAYLDVVMHSWLAILLNVFLGIALILLVVGRFYQRMNA